MTDDTFRRGEGRQKLIILAFFNMRAIARLLWTRFLLSIHDSNNGKDQQDP